MRTIVTFIFALTQHSQENDRFFATIGVFSRGGPPAVTCWPARWPNGSPALACWTLLHFHQHLLAGLAASSPAFAYWTFLHLKVRNWTVFLNCLRPGQPTPTPPLSCPTHAIHAFRARHQGSDVSRREEWDLAWPGSAFEVKSLLNLNKWIALQHVFAVCYPVCRQKSIQGEKSCVGSKEPGKIFFLPNTAIAI